MTEEINKLISENAAFLGLSGAAIVGYFLYAIRALPQVIFRAIDRFIFTTVEVRSDNAAFIYVSQWLSKNGELERARSIRIVDGADTLLSDHQTVSWTATKRFSKRLGNGFPHLILNEMRPVFVTRSMVEHQQKPVDIIRFKSLGRSHKFVDILLKEAEHLSDSKSGIDLYYSDRNYWSHIGVVQERPIETIFMPKGEKEEILEEVGEFLKSKDKYIKIGRPWRLGYLFEGVSGSGKTSLAKAIATTYGLPIFSLSLASVLSDSDLLSLFFNARRKSLVLIEDIDCINFTKDRTKIDNEEGGLVTLSGLLNAMDGVGSPVGVIYVATTNHVNNIDEALLRPGRIDHIKTFNNVNKYQIEKMIEYYCPDISLSCEDVEKIESMGVKASKLQNSLITKGESFMSDYNS